MSAVVDDPTPYPEVNDLLQELLESVQTILGGHLIGMYLDGSLASGDFDQESDDENWVSLIDRAWVGRQNPQLKTQSGDVDGTLDFIRYVLERSKGFETPANEAEG